MALSRFYKPLAQSSISCNMRVQLFDFSAWDFRRSSGIMIFFGSGARDHQMVKTQQMMKTSYNMMQSAASSAYLNSSVCSWFPCSNTPVLADHSTLEVSQTRKELNLQAPVIPL